jgi:hypothetical protein
VRAILGNPCYTRWQVWNRKDLDLVGPANTGLGHRPVQRCPDPSRPGNAYIREDQILPRLPALGIVLGAPGRSSRKQGRAHSPLPARAAELISYLRATGITLIYDPDERTFRAGTHSPVSVIIDANDGSKEITRAGPAGGASTTAGGRSSMLNSAAHGEIQALMGKLCPRGSCKLLHARHQW